MKEIRNKNVSFMGVLRILFNVLIISICVWQQITILNLVVSILAFNTLIYFISYQGYFYYQYDETYIVVKNSWNPFYYKRIRIMDIEKIELKSIAYRGLTLIFYLRNGKKFFITSNNISKENLMQMIDDLGF